MNLYVVVEGEVGEKKVYASWIPFVNPSLQQVGNISDFDQNNFIIISGNGYPNYFDIIKSAAQDVADNENIDMLVIAVDSEELEMEERFSEIEKYVSELQLEIEYSIIVQHFCIETWALGNQLIVKRNPQSYKLKGFLNKYNVSQSDPELLPSNDELDLNRAQFAERYLRALLQEKYRNLTYTKKNPDALLCEKYYLNVKKRLETTGHVGSFKQFLDVFSD